MMVILNNDINENSNNDCNKNVLIKHLVIFIIKLEQKK